MSFCFVLQILYHGPNELPSLSRMYTSNEDPDQRSFISITLIPIVTQSNEQIRNLYESQRKCKFNDDTSLSFFKGAYTRDLCIYECRMKLLSEICECNPFFFTKRGKI